LLRLSRRKDQAIKTLLREAKSLAVEYYKLTGRPLGVTGEVAEYEAAEKLGLTLSAARTQAFDAYKSTDGGVLRYQIKGRALPRENPGRHRVPRILNGDFDFVLLVLLDKATLDTVEIWCAERAAVMDRLDRLPGTSARVGRTMAVSQFKSIPDAKRVWP
jgi:hypothetical protein